MPDAAHIIHTGFRAYVAGLKLSDNPFKGGSAARSFWSEGYTKARRLETQARGDRRPSNTLDRGPCMYSDNIVAADDTCLRCGVKSGEDCRDI